MANQIIRDALKKNNMTQWQLAKKLNINEFSLSRKFREELSEEEKEKILSVIREGKEEK